MNDANNAILIIGDKSDEQCVKEALVKNEIQ
jgi:hypothetical protein